VDRLFGGASARAEVALAQSLPHLELSPKVGIASLGSLSAAFLAAEGGYRFTVMGQPLALLLEVSWYQLGPRQTTDSGATVSGRHDFLSQLASLAWRGRFGADRRWIFSLALGAGVTEAFSSLALSGQPETSQQGSAFCYGATFGVGRSMWHGGPFLEVRYWVRGNLGITNLKGQAGMLLLDLGYRFEAL
jgi:hypothetical protein